VIIGESSREYRSGQDEAVPEGGKCTVSQELLWLWDGDSSETQKGERPRSVVSWC
jgi:hypothetical protein